MQQTIVSVVVPVLAGQVGALQADVEALRDAMQGPNNDYPALKAALPTLHFLSIVTFGARAGVAPGDPDQTPQLIIEANFDGAPGPFWAALEAPMGEAIRGLLRHCAPPLGRSDGMFDAIVAQGSRVPVGPLLERQSIFPSASHAGNRGFSQVRIQRHAALFAAVQLHLPPNAPAPAADAAGIHAALRGTLLPQFPWLDEPFVAPITAADENADLWALLGFAGLALLCAVLPWLLLGRLMHPKAATLAALGTGIFCLGTLKDIGDLLTLAGKAAAPSAWKLLTVGLALAALLAVFIPGGLLAWALLLVAGLLASLLILLAALRARERDDLLHHPPPDVTPDPALVRTLEAFEDCHLAGADHMASLVTIKPGRFRAFLIRFGMRALYLAVRYTATDGYLGSMRTIHFAHWAIVDHGKRLVFFSNFDGSWESYLDDFIEKAHAGLTLAWGNGVGFPSPRYLSLDGATRGRKFKNWARCSMTPSTFWYAAYPNLTVNQIVRQAAVAKGLAAVTLSATDAAAWAKDL
jgi:hypothetical protein